MNDVELDFTVFPLESVDITLEEPEELSVRLENVVIGGSGPNQWSDIFGKPFETIDSNTLAVANGTLKVNTTDDASADNTRPITSAGVHVIVGNIESLLELI